MPSAAATASSASPAWAPRWPPSTRSPQMTTTSPASRSSLGGGAHGVGAARRAAPVRLRSAGDEARSWRPRGSPARRATLRRRGRSRARRPARRAPPPLHPARSAGRRCAAASSVDGRLEATTSRAWLRRTALRTRRSRIGASSTSSVSSTRIASAWSMSDTRADRSTRASARARPLAVPLPGPEVTCAEPSPLRSRCCTRKPSSFVAWPPTRATVSSPERSSAAAAASSARSQLVSRRKPPIRISGVVMRSGAPNDW